MSRWIKRSTLLDPSLPMVEGQMWGWHLSSIYKELPYAESLDEWCVVEAKDSGNELVEARLQEALKRLNGK